MMQKSLHEKRVNAGEKGAEARWRSGGEISSSTKAKLSEAGKKGARAQPREAKVRGGKRGAEVRWGEGGSGISDETRKKLSEAGKKGAKAQPREAKVRGGKNSRRRE
ncbi:MAG: hypothetical protein GX369_01750 [Euryarchaeota archaeon]|nr:hypothetical protein [Euryarchaeota archaeon]